MAGQAYGNSSNQAFTQSAPIAFSGGMNIPPVVSAPSSNTQNDPQVIAQKIREVQAMQRAVSRVGTTSYQNEDQNP